MGVPLFLVTKRRVLENWRTLQLGSSFCELGSFGVNGIMKEHNELMVALDKVREITLFMVFNEISLVVVSTFGIVHVVRPKSVEDHETRTFSLHRSVLSLQIQKCPGRMSVRTLSP
jgi:hypothetical protein